MLETEGRLAWQLMSPECTAPLLIFRDTFDISDSDVWAVCRSRSRLHARPSPALSTRHPAVLGVGLLSPHLTEWLRLTFNLFTPQTGPHSVNDTCIWMRSAVRSQISAWTTVGSWKRLEMTLKVLENSEEKNARNSSFSYNSLKDLRFL